MALWDDVRDRTVSDVPETGRSGHKQRARALNDLQTGIAWPSIGFALACVISFAGLGALAIAGIIPLWLGCYLNALIIMRTFAPLHEAMHANMSGGVRAVVPLERLLGHLLGAMMLLEFQMLRHVHWGHHRHANDPENDPDHWMAGASTPAAFILCFAVIPRYSWYFFSRHVARSGSAMSALGNVLSYVSLYGTAAAALYYGPALEIALVWLAPAYIISSYSAFSHWSLHTPHTSREPFLNAKIIRGSGFRGWCLAHYFSYQHYHLIHHLYPRIPFYRHRAAFKLLEPLLRQKNARIVQYR